LDVIVSKKLHKTKKHWLAKTGEIDNTRVKKSKKIKIIKIQYLPDIQIKETRSILARFSGHLTQLSLSFFLTLEWIK